MAQPNGAWGQDHGTTWQPHRMELGEEKPCRWRCCFQNREGRGRKTKVQPSTPSFLRAFLSPSAKWKQQCFLPQRVEMRIQEITGLNSHYLTQGPLPFVPLPHPALLPGHPCPSAPPTSSSPSLPSVIPKVRPHHQIISNYL